MRNIYICRYVVPPPLLAWYHRVVFGIPLEHPWENLRKERKKEKKVGLRVGILHVECFQNKYTNFQIMPSTRFVGAVAPGRRGGFQKKKIVSVLYVEIPLAMLKQEKNPPAYLSCSMPEISSQIVPSAVL